ncbi:hypothetical protein CQA66_03160 [Helicobacter aurati]|uniref:Uncharacterized protein n=1 Tax=Helicobacter aurati TaxID=137778 RepID=A0A3D8J7R4_9HELI|nr:hypothetical protein CQA66_03160 [Helicobacter aurati]
MDSMRALFCKKAFSFPSTREKQSEHKDSNCSISVLISTIDSYKEQVSSDPINSRVEIGRALFRCYWEIQAQT